MQNGVGLGLGDNNQTLVTNNTIVSNSEGIIVSGNNNIIFGNRIGSNGYMTVRDYGEFNQWDDNISIGNGWFDYNGLGVYNLGQLPYHQCPYHQGRLYWSQMKKTR